MGLLDFRTGSSEQGEVNTFNDQGVGADGVELTGDIERVIERERERERREGGEREVADTW